MWKKPSVGVGLTFAEFEMVPRPNQTVVDNFAACSQRERHDHFVEVADFSSVCHPIQFSAVISEQSLVSESFEKMVPQVKNLPALMLVTLCRAQQFRRLIGGVPCHSPSRSTGGAPKWPRKNFSKSHPKSDRVGRQSGTSDCNPMLEYQLAHLP